MSRRSPVGEQTADPCDERKKWLRAAALATLPCQCVNERPTCTREGAYRSQFQNCQTSRFLRRVVSRGRRQPEPGRAFEWFEIVRGGDPSCSGALSADGRWVRIHTTAPAVGSASKLSTPGALRRTSEVGRSHSLSAYDDSPTICIGTIFSSPRGASCNLTKATAVA